MPTLGWKVLSVYRTLRTFPFILKLLPLHSDVEESGEDPRCRLHTWGMMTLEASRGGYHYFDTSPLSCFFMAAEKSDPACIISMRSYSCFRRGLAKQGRKTPKFKNQTKFQPVWEAKHPLGLWTTARHPADFWAKLIARTWQVSRHPWLPPRISAVTSKSKLFL